jgi:predicted O-linked N-acetylglucosamine transferase (SPINDLY family)
MKAAPTRLVAKFLQAVACHQQGQLLRAQALYREILAANPLHAATLRNIGILAGQLGQTEASAAYFDQAIRAEPDDAVTHCNRGQALQALNRLDEALASYDRAIALQPDLADAYFNRGRVQYLLGRLDASLASYDRTVALRPNSAPAHLNRGNVLKEQRQLPAALASYDQAIAHKPDLASAHVNRGVVLYELKQFDAALASYDRAIALDPGNAEAHYNRGNVLRTLKDYEAAVASYDRAAALQPGMRFLAGDRLEAKMQMCDWADLDAESARLATAIGHGDAVVNPFCLLAFADSAPLQRRAAETWVRHVYPADESLGPIARHGPHARIRIGYFSADFRIHPTSTLIVELIETHDRTKFEVIGFSFGPDTQDELRRKLESAFDRFIDVRDKSDREIALLARRLQIDIAVDLGGFTEDCRAGIFALRAAPLQLSYLGYLGTMGAGYIDYLVADATIIPPAERQHYAEKIVYLPSYQANDSKRPVASGTLTRQELQLPPTGFVYCCFNTNYKITPRVFDSWMRILARVADSVLWLYAHSAAAAGNLRREARQRGVDPARLLFGGRLPFAQYMARFCAADLFLDTLPYNAGTTASDALWAGLPVLTCAGRTFSGRVAASLLNAIRLPELVTSSLAQYEELAVGLALSPQRLADLRQTLADHRRSALLFDTPRFARSLEAAFVQMCARYRDGLPPAHIYVTGDNSSAC